MDERTFFQRWRDRAVNLPGSLSRRWERKRNLRRAARWRLPAGTDHPGFQAVLDRSREPTDVSEHLPTLFLEAVASGGRLFVELGTRGGDSTFALLKASEVTGGRVLSVDLADCSQVADHPAWDFVQADDLAFAGVFPAWCRERGLPEEVDLLLVDTSHAYEHTREELRAWMPLLAPGGRALFHDTHMAGRYRRADGTTGRAYNMRRGVIRAVEEYLGMQVDETRPFRTLLNGYVVEHIPTCNGLTILRRV